jgi:hypothetical protein
MTMLPTSMVVVLASVAALALAIFLRGGIEAVRRQAGLLVLLAALVSVIGLMILFVRDPSAAFGLWAQLIEFLFQVAFAGFGAYFVFWRREVSMRILEYRLRVWKIGYRAFDVRIGQVIVLVVGTAFAIGGLIRAADLLIRR